MRLQENSDVDKSVQKVRSNINVNQHLGSDKQRLSKDNKDIASNFLKDDINDISNQYSDKSIHVNNSKNEKKLSKRDFAKQILIKEYNFPEDDAEIKIREMEKNEYNIKQSNLNNNLNNEKTNDDVHTNQLIENEDKNNSNIRESNLDILMDELTIGSSDDSKYNVNPIKKEFKTNNDLNDSEVIVESSKSNLGGFKEISASLHNKFNPKNDNSNHLEDVALQDISGASVDDLIQDIIPNYNKKVSIELSHVDLTFDVIDDKIDNLKEQFIRTLKRNKGKKKSIHALKDISFKIYAGEKVGIIGYNGAGKSTLLNVITGIYPPDEGVVKTYGKISPLLALGAGFDYNYSGARNIFLNGAVLGYTKKFLLEKYDEIVEFSELEEFINLPIKNYSSGMLAKLGFSIATIVEPDILIIDEILGVGDVNFQRKSADKIRSLMDCGTTVLLVSHSIPQIRNLCDKAIWIDQGRVREIGEVNKVCDNYLKDSEKASRAQLNNIKFK